jgi:hypothetical protein
MTHCNLFLAIETFFQKSSGLCLFFVQVIPFSRPLWYNIGKTDALFSREE